MKKIHDLARNKIFRLASLPLCIMAISSCSDKPDEAGSTDTMTNDQTNSAPVISVTSNPVSLNGVAPFMLSLDASNSSDEDGDSLTFSWDQFDDGSVESTDSVASFSFTTPGDNQPIKLTVDDGNGNVVSETFLVNVDPENIGSVEPTSHAVATVSSGYEPLMTTLDGTGSSNVESYSWMLNDEEVSTQASFEVTLDAGTYLYILNVMSADGSTDSSSVEVVVNEVVEGEDNPPIAQLSASTLTGEIPFDVDFTSLSTDDKPGMSFSWLVDGVEQSTQESFTHTFDVAGDFDVELVVSDSSDQATRTSVEIRAIEAFVDQPPVADIRVIGSLIGEQSVFANLDASGSSDDVDDVTYKWFVDGLESDNTTSAFQQTFDAVGAYEITLQVMDSKGQSDETSKTVTVNAVRVNGAPIADVSGTGPIVGIAPTTVLFKSLNSTDDDGIDSIHWDFGDGNSSTDANPKYEYTATGTYKAVLTVTDSDGLTDSVSVDITMIDEVGTGSAPMAHINVSSVRGTVPLDVTLDASGSMTSSNIVSYEWDFGGGSFKYGEFVEHTFTDALEHKVYLTVTDDQGLSHETFVEVTALLSVPEGTPGVAMQTDGNPFLDSAFYVSPDIRVLQDESLELIDPVSQEKLYTDIRFVQQMPSAVWLDRTVAIYGGEDNDGRRPLSKFMAGDGNVLEGHFDEAMIQQEALAVDGVKPPMTAVIIVYNLPDRDCAALASNGQLNETKDGPDADSLPDGDGLDRYKTEYIDVIADIFAMYPDIRIVAMLEPDGYPNMITNVDPYVTATDDCNAVKEAGVYKEGLQYAINAFHDMPNVYTYIDIGHSGWLGWDNTNTDNLQRSVVGFTDLVAGATESGDLGAIRGFASNTSGYTPLREPFVASTHEARQQLVPFYEWNRHVDELSFIDTMYKRFTTGDEVLGDGNAVRQIAGQGFPDNLGFIIDTARNGWGGPNRPTGEGAPATMDDGDFRVDRRVHRGHWCNVNNAGIGEIPQAQPDPERPYLDAYYWMKPPGESDGISTLTDGANDEGKSYDPMCGGESSNSTGIEADVIQGAPHAGHWFHDQFIMLINNAYPTLGVKAPQGGSDAAAFADDFNAYTTGGSPNGAWSAEATAGAAVSVNETNYYGLQGKSVGFTAVEEDRNNDSVATILVEEDQLAGAMSDQYGRFRLFGDAVGDAAETYWSMLNFHGAKPDRQWHQMFWSLGSYEGNFAANVVVGNGGPVCRVVSSTPVPQDQWSCVEWNFDAPNNELSIWLDGELIEDLQINAESAGCSSQSWIAPDAITSLEVGVARYRPDHNQQVDQNAPEPEPKPDVTIHVDDFAVGGSRLGCNKVRVQ